MDPEHLLRLCLFVLCAFLISSSTLAIWVVPRIPCVLGSLLWLARRQALCGRHKGTAARDKDYKQEEAKQTDKQIRGELDGKNGRKQGFSAGSLCSSWDKRRLSNQTATTVGKTRQVWGLITEIFLMLLDKHISLSPTFAFSFICFFLCWIQSCAKRF